jgi:hypothetical protein
LNARRRVGPQTLQLLFDSWSFGNDGETSWPHNKCNYIFLLKKKINQKRKEYSISMEPAAIFLFVVYFFSENFKISQKLEKSQKVV